MVPSVVPADTVPQVGHRRPRSGRHVKMVEFLGSMNLEAVEEIRATCADTGRYIAALLNLYRDRFDFSRVKVLTEIDNVWDA